MSPETQAITYGLSSALIWGAGDFAAGVATRRGSVLTLVLFSQIAGCVLLVLLALLFAESIPDIGHLAAGALAGMFGVLGLILLYKGLALGRMGIVAPLSAVVTAVIPVVFSFFMEGAPGMGPFIGFGIALAAVWLLSSPGGSASIQKNEVVLSVTAGFGFGLFFVLMGYASDQAVLWSLVAARAGSIPLMIVIVAAGGLLNSPLKSQLPYILVVGVLDSAGNGLFAMASHVGRLDISAVLASLYPASTVFLAWLILKEKLRPPQWAGVLLSLTALYFISA